MALSAVQPGMACVGKTVLQGTQISDFNVQIVDIVGTGSDARILARASGAGVDSTGVAQGFSGSPVYCPTGDGGSAIAGAVSAGTLDYGNLLILVTPIEFISTILVRPFSLAVRLFANMLAGHILLVTFAVLSSGLAVAKWYVVFAPLPIAGVIMFTAFEVFVSFLQAYVFTLLTGVYINAAQSHEH